MGLTKTEFYTEQQKTIAAVAKAVGHPARVAILQYLVKINSCVCGDIVNEIGLAQPTISQHLKELKKVGLIQGDVEGVKVCYCINPAMFKKVNTIFNKMFEGPIGGNCC